MVFQERSKKSCVPTGGFHLIDSIDKITDAAACRLECLSDPEIPAKMFSDCLCAGYKIYLRGVVEDTTHIILIRTNIIWIPIKDLPNNINSR